MLRMYLLTFAQLFRANALDSIKTLEQELEQMQGSAVRSHGRR